jgi:hypothetical protein
MSVTDIFELGRQAMFAEEFDITRWDTGVVETARDVDEFLCYFEERLESVLWEIFG